MTWRPARPIAGVGLAIGSVPVAAAGAILVAHSGMDRMMGYGLKLPSSFKDTHLGRIGQQPLRPQRCP